MNPRFPPLLVWLATAIVGFAFLPAHGHCPGTPPKVTIAKPDPGKSVVESCFPDYSFCKIDTFHQETLHKELAGKYKAARHVAFGYIDSIQSFVKSDTQFFTPTEFFVDTSRWENVYLTFHSHLKGSLAQETFAFEDSFVYVPEQPYATSYLTLIDTPFIAMFDTTLHIRDIGIGPMDGCYFEPYAYMVIDGRIHKKGWGYITGDRMPGVSVPLDDLLKDVGGPSVAPPPIRPRKPGAIQDYRALRKPREVPGTRTWYDLKGRAQGRRDGAKPLPRGCYLPWNTTPGH